MVERREHIKNRLVERTIPLEHIYLDPNNLRLAGIRSETSESRFFEDGVQNSVRLQMQRFDIESLKKSFIGQGILNVDSIVVKEYDPEHYVVVEGNRRITALKDILEEHNSGELDLSPRRLEEVRSIDVLVLNDANKEDTLLIQGLRHVPGIREWGAFERSEAIKYLVDSGYNYREVSNILGGILTPSVVGRYYRAREALQQMMDDDEYGNYAKTDYFTYYDELLKARFREIREWLEWDSDEHIFENEENRKLFYKWLTGEGDNENRQIRTVRELRDLPKIFQHVSAKNALIEGSTVEAALRYILVPIEWRLRLKEIEAFLRSEIPITEVFTEDDRDLVKRILDLVNVILTRISPNNQ